MNRALVTGGAGFFGGFLKRRLLDAGIPCISLDRLADDFTHPLFTAVQGDIRDAALLDSILSKNPVDVVFHCAAELAHGVRDKAELWSANVGGSESIAKAAKAHRVVKVVFISSNCLWGRGYHHPVAEDLPPEPVEAYGQSKLEAEHVFQRYANDFQTVIIRTPTIIDSGRMGLLAILFQFIEEGRRVWLVGGGANRYQFIHAGDLADACIAAADYSGSNVFHVGSDNVRSLREVYQYVIDRAQTGARTASLPRFPTLLLMRLLYAAGLSPLGPYHYKMIAENFSFDTRRAKELLHWKPTVTNEQMLYNAYVFYTQNAKQLAEQNVSAHRRPSQMGAIRLLKWLS